MRPGPEFATVSHAAGAPMGAAGHGLINGTAAAHSPWQSPVPYLFGGLAAMLGLIAFALLILACSYWKLSGYLDAGAEGGRDGQGGDGAGGEKGSASGAARPAAEFQEHVVVIMAGDERPTFLAKPATSRAAAEVELASAAPAASGTAGADGQEKKVDECEVSSTQLGGDGTVDAASRSHDHDAAASRGLEEDAAATRSGGHHHHTHHDDEGSSSSSGTTALQERSQQ
uniref:Uncharacterized protein n=1 Tax=Avena sativa TaxID=4498 RepID=A0ACD6AFA0_AVESA